MKRRGGDERPTSPYLAWGRAIDTAPAALARTRSPLPARGVL